MFVKPELMTDNLAGLLNGWEGMGSQLAEYVSEEGRNAVRYRRPVIKTSRRRPRRWTGCAEMRTRRGIGCAIR